MNQNMREEGGIVGWKERKEFLYVDSQIECDARRRR
jgi:hypothetical protein